MRDYFYHVGLFVETFAKETNKVAETIEVYG